MPFQKKLGVLSLVLAAMALATGLAFAQYGPPADGPRGVIKVLPDDVLYVRAQPDGDSAIVGALPFDAWGIKATGRMKVVGRTTWVEVSHGGFKGWASGHYLGHVGAPRDVTGIWAKRLGNPRGATPQAVADKFRAAVAGDMEGGEGSPSVKLVGVTGKLPIRAVVIADGYMDDSVRGDQFVITVVYDGSAYVIDRIWASPICDRGVGDSGLCT